MLTRGTWIYDPATDRMVPKAEFLRMKAESRAKNRSALPTPGVIGGSIEPIKSMVDGKIYDDKASYYKSVDRAGCAIVGFDKDWTKHVANPLDEKALEADVVGDVKRAIEEESSK